MFDLLYFPTFLTNQVVLRLVYHSRLKVSYNNTFNITFFILTTLHKVTLISFKILICSCLHHFHPLLSYPLGLNREPNLKCVSNIFLFLNDRLLVQLSKLAGYGTFRVIPVVVLKVIGWYLYIFGVTITFTLDSVGSNYMII